MVVAVIVLIAVAILGGVAAFRPPTRIDLAGAGLFLLAVFELLRLLGTIPQ